MARGNTYVGGAALLTLAMLLAPAVLADTESPVSAQPHVDYQADAGAILAQFKAFDPKLHLTFTFDHATLYEVRIGALLPAETKSAGVPQVVGVQVLGAGALKLDPAHGVDLLLLTDPAGLGLASLPVQAPADPAKFLVEVTDLAGQVGRTDVDPHHLSLADSLTYTIHGVVYDAPVRATADGDLVAVLADGPVQVLDSHGTVADERHAGKDAAGERLLVLQAKGAHVILEGTGMTAVLQMPTASIDAGGKVLANVLGRPVGADQNAGAQSGKDGLGLHHASDLAGVLLGSAPEGAASRGPGSQSGGIAPLDAQTAGAAAALGGVLALVAVGLAGLVAVGKPGLFALLAPLYARLQHDEVLNNSGREALYKHVVENPGVNVSDLVKHFGLGWGATVYHLRVLERNHLVVPQKHGRQVCYFQNGGRYHGQMQGISVLRNANAAAIARVVLANPGSQQRELCKMTKLAQPTVSWHLQRMEETGLVTSDGGARKKYSASPALQALVERGLLAQAPREASAPSPSATTPTTVMSA